MKVAKSDFLLVLRPVYICKGIEIGENLHGYSILLFFAQWDRQSNGNFTLVFEQTEMAQDNIYEMSKYNII